MLPSRLLDMFVASVKASSESFWRPSNDLKHKYVIYLRLFIILLFNYL